MRRRETHEWFFEIGTDLGRLGEELARSGPMLARGMHWEPRVDVIEEPERLLVKAEISGVRGEDISLVYLPERHSLLIRGRRLQEDSIDNQTIAHQLEIYYGEFEREIGLPELSLKPSAIKAQYRNGFLLVTIPKLEIGSPSPTRSFNERQ